MAPKGITELSKPPTAFEKKVYKESVDKCKDQIAEQKKEIKKTEVAPSKKQNIQSKQEINIKSQNKQKVKKEKKGEAASEEAPKGDDRWEATNNIDTELAKNGGFSGTNGDGFNQQEELTLVTALDGDKL